MSAPSAPVGRWNGDETTIDSVEFMIVVIGQPPGTSTPSANASTIEQAHERKAYLEHLEIALRHQPPKRFEILWRSVQTFPRLYGEWERWQDEVASS